MSPVSITPFLWFDDQAHQAAKYYCSVFKGSKIIAKDAMSATLRLMGRDYVLFNGGPHYKLTPAMSLFVSVKTQKELDTYWNKLLKGGEPSRCGWLVDRFGVSWQVVPTVLQELLGDPDYERSGRAMQAMLGMVKLDIAALKAAADGADEKKGKTKAKGRSARR